MKSVRRRIGLIALFIGMAKNSMQPLHLAGIDYTILIANVACVIGIGWNLALRENIVGLSDVRALGSNLGHRPGFYFRKSWRARTRRHGRERREIRHQHRALS